MLEQTDKKDDTLLWAVRTGVIREDESEEWKKRRATPLTDLNNQIQKATYGEQKAYSLFDEGHTRIVASMVPDEIIYNVEDYSKREFDACLLFGDVSGFTDLCEKYNKSGKGGPSKLTQVLNAYIGAMVQEILSHSGDVLNFSGDAFIALWKETDHLSLRDAVHEAIDCSLIIQKTYGTYVTDVDVVVRVKLAVACGHLVFALIGDQQNSHYIMTGSPIIDIKAAEQLSRAGEIIITARVSHHLSANEYLIHLLPDGMNAKVVGVGPNWRNIQRVYVRKSEKFGIIVADDEEIEAGSLSSSSSGESDSKEGSTEIASRSVNDQYALRPAVNFAARMRVKEALRKFIIAPVMRGIDAEEPIEYLTEIRQVVILFINCKVSGTITNFQGIDVASEVYLIVCNVVKNNFGCVNKISNFDKDLMLLVIFGLRGFKDELESQIALRCAKECFEKISDIEFIDDVACAVTTGKTYCGAFGHSLRREYTVIGLVVNKAARLMCAYPNRVSCDRESFLHSKLESRNFILQEYIPLKGIISPGPIYEFKEVEKSKDLKLSVSPLPLLGRDRELDLYKALCDKAMRHTKAHSSELFPNMLIYQAAYRQGKTRLLDEVLYITDTSISIQRLNLTRLDYNSPYKAIRLIFSPFMEKPENSTTEFTSGKISAKMNKTELAPYLCALNPIFDLHYDVTSKYNNLHEAEKCKIDLKVFKMLCKQSFMEFSVIAIDDSENVDDESWLLISELLNLNLVFIVSTMGTEKAISAKALNVLKNPKIKSIELKIVEKWYHVGLACQMLKVDGIPPELEKTIQVKSNGNPGWIESFLVTIMQSGGLIINEMTRKKAYNSGIVIPPLYMVMRLSKEEMKRYVEIMEEKECKKKDDILGTRWKMYVDSCRESFPDLAVAKTFGREFLSSGLVRIATLNKQFNIEDVDPEMIIDVVILKTFDALTSYEQLLLKCSSILGDLFPRDMLLYIMSSSSMRLTAIAVQKLFEIQVLCCARGNFLEGGLNFKDRLINPNEDMSIRCDCKGLLVEELCADLPKYASCGYLRFRSSEFRETTYNLLTDNQKRELHEKAIRYLEKETRKCRACGTGYFSRRLGAGKIDNTLRKIPRAPKKRRIGTTTSADTESIFETSGSIKSRTGSRASGDSSIAARSKEVFKMNTSVVGSSIDSDDFGDISSNISELKASSVKKIKQSASLMRTFSTSDFSQCTCLLILNTMYSQLIRHCKGAGLGEHLLDATVEYAYVCIDNRNIPQAIKLLSQALVLLEGPLKDHMELDWMVSFKRGKLLALMGGARMQLLDDECYKYFMKSLKNYDVRFPTSRIERALVKYRFRIKHALKLDYMSSLFARKYDDDVADYCNNVAECLTFLCKWFIRKGRFAEAELAAIWSLTKAMKTQTDFEILCTAYANLIYVWSTIGRNSAAMGLEIYALKLCQMKKTFVELEELRAVAALYFNVSRARIRRAEIDNYLLIGFMTWRLSTASQNESLVFRVLPLLALAIMVKKQFTEFGNLLQEVEYLTELDNDNSEKSWYHALCMLLHLETGLCVQPYAKCIRFMQGEGLEPTIRDPDGKTRLVISIWLWEVRNQNWEAAIVWQKFAWSFRVSEIGESIQNLVTALFLLEGLIIYMVNKMDMKNLKAIAKAEKLIQMMFKSLTKAEKYCQFIKPRLYHMRAYYKISKFNDYKGAFDLLKIGRKYAEKCMNELDWSYMKHSELAWLRKLTREDRDFWKEHADEDNLIDFMEGIEKVRHFTLPIPLYV